ncbi:MAG: hypothetical protein IJ493_11710 [Clostridia bacterium]|nr:hypothetical protein [Clostridia bacterium]
MVKFRSGRKLIEAIDAYVTECRSVDTKKPIFANIAGFCRSAGISVGDYLSLKKRFPAEFELAGAYFEDAALNSGATASLVGMYLRQYGYWGKPAEDEVVCEHDLYEDGV